ncbi:MAG: RNA polymerase sigma factor [Chitinivibrionales bacterium]
MNKEKQLIDKARRGDRQALRKILGAQTDLVSSVIRHNLWDQQSAKDCAQNIMCRIVQRIDTFQGQCRIATWVYRLAVNECIEMNRQHQRSQRLSSWDYDRHPFIDLDAPDGLAAVERAEIESCIEEAVEAMSGSIRDAFEKFYREQLSGREAAAALGISEAAFYMRLKTAREAIRKHFENRGML